MSKICSYAQGFAQMRKASEDHEYGFKTGRISYDMERGLYHSLNSKLKMLMIITQNYKTYY